jgi:hypothetical protein
VVVDDRKLLSVVAMLISGAFVLYLLLSIGLLYFAR